MPIYEYQCAACGGVVEKWQKISEDPLTTCPVCGGGLSKLISSCSFHLKGSGWYVTDYSGHNAASANPAGEAAPTPASDSSAKPTESKAAEKAGTTAAPKKFT